MPRIHEYLEYQKIWSETQKLLGCFYQAKQSIFPSLFSTKYIGLLEILKRTVNNSRHEHCLFYNCSLRIL